MMIPPRDNYISWSEYFMGIAVLSAQRSKDPNTQVGACIISTKNIIIGTGYNGFPTGCLDSQLPWGRDGDFLNTKYPYVIHAEENAIANSNNNLTGCTLYVTLFPCHNCAKTIIQQGIKTIIYLRDQVNMEHQDSIIAAKRMFDLSGVRYSKYITKDNRNTELKINLE